MTDRAHATRARSTSRTPRTRHRLAAGLTVIAAVLALPWSALAQLPTAKLSTIFPPGGQVGSEFEVKITGEDLDQATKLHFSHPGITAEPKTLEANEFFDKERRKKGEFVVKIGKDVSPGVYEVRVVGRFGISNPRAFAVGTLPEITPEQNHQSRDDALPVEIGTTVNGQIDKERIDWYSFELKKGQDVLIDCWGQRIDSRMDPTLVIYNPGGRELNRVRDTVQRDPVLDFTAPQDGTYKLAVYDFTYEGGSAYPYRLSIHTGPFVDFVFPPVGLEGKSGKFTLYGRNLPGGKPVKDMRLRRRGIQQTTVDIALNDKTPNRQPIAAVVTPHASQVRGRLYRVKTAQGESNPVTIRFATAPVVIESEPDNDDAAKAETVEFPCEYVGQFYPRSDRDWLQFEAKKGEVVWISVFSHRLGLPTDPLLLIQKITKDKDGNKKIDTVATVDDPDTDRNRQPEMFDDQTFDPTHRLKVNEDATYRILIKDQFASGQSSPRRMYRLILHKQRADFDLVAYAKPEMDRRKEMSPKSMVLRSGGAAAMKVRVFRRGGFRGEVDIRVEGLPQGVTCRGATIGGRVNEGWLVFEAADNAKPWAGAIRVIGTAEADGKKVTRYARGATLLWAFKQNERPFARLTRDIGLSVIDSEKAPISVEAGDGKMLETALGGKIDLPVKVTKRGEVKGDVKVGDAYLPRDLEANDQTIKGGSGKVTIDVKSNRVPTGTYTFYLQGTAKVRYERNPEAIKRAEAEKKRLDDLHKDFTAKRDEANKARDTARSEAQKAENTLKQAEGEVKQAEQAVKQAEDNVKAAQKKLADATKAAKAAPDDKGKQDAVKQAKSQLEQAKNEQATAEDKLAKAKQAASEAKTALTKAEEEKKAAEKAAEEADDRLKKADDLRKQADRDLNDTKNRNKPRDIDLKVVSSPVRLRIVRSPIELTVKSPGAPIKQGEKSQVTVNVKRLYGFDQNVDLNVDAPGGVRGISVKEQRIDKGKSSVQLEVSVSDDATPGKHTYQLEARTRFGNVTEETVTPFTIEVQEVKKEEKK